MDPYLPLLILAFPGSLLLQIYVLGVRMSRPEKMIKPIGGAVPPQYAAPVLGSEPWLNANGFEFNTAFQFGSLFTIIYGQRGAPRFLSFIFEPNALKPTLDLETYFENDAMLDTGTSRSIGLFPRPNAYAQNFPGHSLESIWNSHLEAEGYLRERFQLVPRANFGTYLEELKAAIHIRMKYVRSQSFWPVRVLFRYFRRSSLYGKTVAERYH